MGVRERSSQGKEFTSEDATYSDREIRPLSCARPAARSEEHGARSKDGEELKISLPRSPGRSVS